MKNVLFKDFTLRIQFFGHEPIKKDIQLPFYPKAWRKHPAYDQAFRNAICNVALSLGLAPTAKPCCYSLLSAEDFRGCYSITK
jgi:hypothetical protein